LLLVAACGGASTRVAVAPDAAGPDHQLAMTASDLGPGWGATEPPQERSCVSEFAAGLGGHVETVNLSKDRASLLEEIRTVTGKDTENSADALRAACPRDTGEEPQVPDRRARYGQDPIVRQAGSTWSVWQPTDTGVVILTGEGVSLAEAYAAFEQRRGNWQRDRTARAQALWESKGPSSYTMTMTRGCFCPSGDYRVTVVDGKVMHSVDKDGDDKPQGAQTVDSIYRSLKTLKEPTYSLRFDLVLGYPTVLSVDAIPNAIDDEYGLRITDLKAL
jgi:hypothetical protein